MIVIYGIEEIEKAKQEYEAIEIALLVGHPITADDVLELHKIIQNNRILK